LSVTRIVRGTRGSASKSDPFFGRFHSPACGASLLPFRSAIRSGDAVSGHAVLYPALISSDLRRCARNVAPSTKCEARSLRQPVGAESPEVLGGWERRVWWRGGEVPRPASRESHAGRGAQCPGLGRTTNLAPHSTDTCASRSSEFRRCVEFEGHGRCAEWCMLRARHRAPERLPVRSTLQGMQGIGGRSPTPIPCTRSAGRTAA
jgi:hypothetical protein